MSHDPSNEAAPSLPVPASATSVDPPTNKRLHPKQRLIGSSSSCRENRRAAVLRRQRDKRRELTDHLRALVLNAVAEEEKEEEKEAEAENDDDQGMILDTTTRDDGKKKSRKKQHTHDLDRQYYASQFSIPEWMVEVPHDLNGKNDTDEQGRGWFVLPRPEGKRCLMVASGGVTVTRLANGDVLHRFASCLPNGSARSRGPRGGWTLLDCIYHEPDKTYYVLDLLCWRSMEFYDCTCEFRFFFLRSKFAEEMAEGKSDTVVKGSHEYRFRPLLYYDCDGEGLRRAYAEFVPFVRDGLLFFSKQGYYEMGLSPLMLVWKDSASSRYFLARPLSCVLAVSGDGRLCTLEGLVVGQVSAEEMSSWGLGLELKEREEREEEGAAVTTTATSTLVRFSYDSAREDEEMQQHEIQGLRVDKKCSTSRATADPWSKILFHSRSKEGEGITMETMLHAATAANAVLGQAEGQEMMQA